MPRFQVIEKRAQWSGVIIDAENEDAARRGDGQVIDAAESDTWGDELHSVEEVADDCEEVELP